MQLLQNVNNGMAPPPFIFCICSKASLVLLWVEPSEALPRGSKFKKSSGLRTPEIR